MIAEGELDSSEMSDLGEYADGWKEARKHGKRKKDGSSSDNESRPHNSKKHSKFLLAELQNKYQIVLQEKDLAEARIKKLEDTVNELTKKLATGNVSVDLHIPNEWTANGSQNVISVHNSETIKNLASEAAEDLEMADIDESAAPPAAPTNIINEMENADNMGATSIQLQREMAKKTGAVPKITERTDGVQQGKVSPPVVKIYNVNVKAFTRKLVELLRHKLFSINIINKNLIHLKLKKSEDHSKVRQYQETQGTSFYTYTPIELKPSTLIIRGLSETYDESDLREFIDECSLDLKVNRVVRLVGDRWLVQFTNDSDTKAFSRLQYLLNTKVKIGQYKREGLIQCRNCQRFGHISTNCRMPYRCVKCGQSHGPGKCAIPPREQNVEESLTTDPATGEIVKTKGRPIMCINCNKAGHVASDKKCPRRLELLEKMERRKRENDVVVVTQPARLINASKVASNGPSYANMARTPVFELPPNFTQSQSAERMKQKQAMGIFDSECKRLLGKDFLTCMQRIGDYAATYRQLKSDEERSQALFGLMLSLRL